jgi:arsenite methyltransferase
LAAIEAAGFQKVTIQKRKPIHIPTDLLEKYLDPTEMATFQTGQTGILSITVYGEKPGLKSEKPRIKLSDLQSGNCCSPGAC